MKKNRSYTREFKSRIIQEIIRKEKTLAQAGREYEIACSTISTWVRRYRDGQPVNTGQTRAEKAREREQGRKIAQLEQLVGQQALEITLLKKVRELSERKLKEELSGKPIVGALS